MGLMQATPGEMKSFRPSALRMALMVCGCVYVWVCICVGVYMGGGIGWGRGEEEEEEEEARRRIIDGDGRRDWSAAGSGLGPSDRL